MRIWRLLAGWFYGRPTRTERWDVISREQEQAQRRLGMEPDLRLAAPEPVIARGPGKSHATGRARTVISGV